MASFDLIVISPQSKQCKVSGIPKCMFPITAFEWNHIGKSLRELKNATKEVECTNGGHACTLNWNFLKMYNKCQLIKFDQFASKQEWDAVIRFVDMIKDNSFLEELKEFINTYSPYDIFQELLSDIKNEVSHYVRRKEIIDENALTNHDIQIIASKYFNQSSDWEFDRLDLVKDLRTYLVQKTVKNKEYDQIIAELESSTDAVSSVIKEGIGIWYPFPPSVNRNIHSSKSISSATLPPFPLPFKMDFPNPPLPVSTPLPSLPIPAFPPYAPSSSVSTPPSFPVPFTPPPSVRAFLPSLSVPLPSFRPTAVSTVVPQSASSTANFGHPYPMPPHPYPMPPHPNLSS